MSYTYIGKITHLTRYPVKSMAGEAMKRAPIAPYGLYGDRSHALIDNDKEGWDSFITARRYPQMLGYTASLPDSGGTKEAFPEVQIAAPDGRLLHWTDDLLEELGGFPNRSISLKRHRPDSKELLAVDAGGLLLITDRSLRKIEERMGAPVDPRRFRANIMIELDEDAAEDEYAWVGSRLHLEDGTVLEVVEPCERCMLVTLDPDTRERNNAVLLAVKDVMNLQFGVYASVIRTGEVAVGDKLYMEKIDTASS
ncbi:MOSC domain-containing protein [Paenibacillus aestuarii]|uniref:MOSC domain-containing protein n=1 Tax=Paenibacillus aestuarii TaxID=516965 RepID=A0ABW0K935_9BACL|nr:MOSC domain-containing protein [Paenibacillus aestuarii]